MYRYTAFERGKTDVHPSYILQYIICPHRLLFIACIFSTQATFCSICFVHLSYFLQYIFCLSKLLFVTLPTETTIQYIFCPPKFPVTVYILSTLATLYNTYFVQLHFYNIYFAYRSYLFQYIFCPTKFLFTVYIFYSIHSTFCSIYLVHQSFFLLYIFYPPKPLFIVYILST